MNTDRQYRINFANFREKFWRNSKIPLAEKVIFQDLIFYAGVTGKSFPSQATLASNHGISARYVRMIIKKLKQDGWLDWRKGGLGKSNKYEFHSELYSSTANPKRNSVSSKSGNTVPLTKGNGVPPKVVNDSSQRKESYRIADKDQTKDPLIDPETFTPNSGEENAALEAWENLEPNNSRAFTTTYHAACRKGLPAHKFYEFTSEINESPRVKKKGAVFNRKVKDYFANRSQSASAAPF